MNKTLFIAEVRTTEDNWNWQQNVIEQIREWFK